MIKQSPPIFELNSFTVPARIGVVICSTVIIVGAFWGRNLERKFQTLATLIPYFAATTIVLALSTLFLYLRHKKIALIINSDTKINLLLLCFAIFGAIATQKYLVGLEIETVHLIKYFLLSFFCFFSQKETPLFTRLWRAALFSSLFGTIEESCQRYIPERVFDIRDILLNITSSSCLGSLAGYSLAGIFQTLISHCVRNPGLKNSSDAS